MKFFKGLLVSLLILLLGILTSIFILTEGLKTVILKPTLVHKIIDNFPLREVVPELLAQYISTSSASNKISTEDIKGILKEVLTDELEVYLKTQSKDAVTKFYAFINSETDELSIEISLPDITEKLFEAMPLDQILTDLELPFDMCEGGGTNCINLEDLNSDDLEGLMEQFMSGEDVLGAQNAITEDVQSHIPTSITITADDLPVEVLEIRDVIQLVKYSGWMLGIAILLISLLVVVIQKWKGLITVGKTLITTAFSFLLISILSPFLEKFTTNLMTSQVPLEVEGIVNAISDIVLQFSEFLMQQWLNYSLIIGGIGIALTIIGMILKKKYQSEETVSKVPEPKTIKVKTATETTATEFPQSEPTEVKSVIEPKEQE